MCVLYRCELALQNGSWISDHSESLRREWARNAHVQILSEYVVNGFMRNSVEVPRQAPTPGMAIGKGRVIGINTWSAVDNNGFSVSIRSDRVKEILADTAFHDQIDWSLFP